MAESKMPARIWCDRVDADMCRKQFRPDDITYIRADLVEPLVEALQWALAEIDKQTTYQHPGQFLACDTKARAALAAYAAAQSGQAQTEARG